MTENPPIPEISTPLPAAQMLPEEGEALGIPQEDISALSEVQAAEKAQVEAAENTPPEADLVQAQQKEEVAKAEEAAQAPQTPAAEVKPAQTVGSQAPTTPAPAASPSQSQAQSQQPQAQTTSQQASPSTPAPSAPPPPPTHQYGQDAVAVPTNQPAPQTGQESAVSPETEVDVAKTTGQSLEDAYIEATDKAQEKEHIRHANQENVRSSKPQVESLTPVEKKEAVVEATQKNAQIERVLPQDKNDISPPKQTPPTQGKAQGVGYSGR